MEALAVLEKALGPNHIELADVLNSCVSERVSP